MKRTAAKIFALVAASVKSAHVGVRWAPSEYEAEAHPKSGPPPPSTEGKTPGGEGRDVAPSVTLLVMITHLRARELPDKAGVGEAQFANEAPHFRGRISPILRFAQISSGHWGRFSPRQRNVQIRRISRRWEDRRPTGVTMGATSAFADLRVTQGILQKDTNAPKAF